MRETSVTNSIYSNVGWVSTQKVFLISQSTFRIPGWIIQYPSLRLRPWCEIQPRTSYTWAQKIPWKPTYWGNETTSKAPENNQLKIMNKLCIRIWCENSGWISLNIYVIAFMGSYTLWACAWTFGSWSIFQLLPLKLEREDTALSTRSVAWPSIGGWPRSLRGCSVHSRGRISFLFKI